VDAHRDGLADVEKTGFNHPSTIYKAFHRRTQASASGGRGRRAAGGAGGGANQAQIAALQAEIAARDAVIQATRDAYDQLEQDTAARIAQLERQLAGPAGLNGYAAFPLLGLDQPFTKNEVDQAYRQAAKAYHPDTGGSGRQMQLLHAERDAARQMARPARAPRGRGTPAASASP
jgi:hypothetical protein